jgi:hypothetical protein
VGALANLGHRVSDQIVGNVLRAARIEPAPKRSQNTTWREFFQSAVLASSDLIDKLGVVLFPSIPPGT